MIDFSDCDCIWAQRKGINNWDLMKDPPRPCRKCRDRFLQEDMVDRYIELSNFPDCVCPLNGGTEPVYCCLHESLWGSPIPNAVLEADLMSKLFNDSVFQKIGLLSTIIALEDPSK